MIFKGYPGGTQAESMTPGSGKWRGQGAVYSIQFAESSIEGCKCQDTGYRMDANARIQDERMHRTEDRG